MKLKIVVITIIFAVLFIGCSQDSDKDKDKSIQNSNTHKSNIKPIQSKKSTQVLVKKIKKVPTLKDELDNLLKYNGKKCSKDAVYIRSTSVQHSYSSGTSKKYKSVQSTGSGNYNVREYGGDEIRTYYGGTVHITIQNNSQETIMVSVRIDYDDYFDTGFFPFSNQESYSEIIHIKPGEYKYSKLFDKPRNRILKNVKSTLSVYSLEDDSSLYSEAESLEDYVEYLQHDSNYRYYIDEAQLKIKDLMYAKIYKEALALATEKERIIALEKYLEVFKNPFAKKMLVLNKKAVVLLKMTTDYNTVLWELDNPLLVSFKSAISKEYRSRNLLSYIDDYISMSKKRYIENSMIRDTMSSPLPVFVDYKRQIPSIEYPNKPTLIKGEFEKNNDFENKKNKALKDWNEEVSKIETQYRNSIKRMKKEDTTKYENAKKEWEQNSKLILKKNKQNKIEFEKRIKEIPKKREYWRWQAVLQAIGDKPLEFKKLDYNSEEEVFEYILSGGIIKLKFEGTIAVPIASAKEFKENMKSKDKRLKFSIENNELFLSGVGYKEEIYKYHIINYNKLVIVDKGKLFAEKKEIILAKEQKERDIKFAKEQKERDIKFAKKQKEKEKKKRIALGIYTDRGLMWQDIRHVKKRQKTKEYAKKYCKRLKIGSYGDWRLPTYDELMSLKKDEFFKDTAEYSSDLGFWSDTVPHSYGPNVRYIVYLNHNKLDSTKVWKSTYDRVAPMYNIRCVQNQ